MENRHKKCLLCNGTELIPLKDYEHAYLVNCRACDFIFCQRIPTLEELEDYYNDYPRGGAISQITIKRYNELLDRFDTCKKTNNILDIGCGNGYFLEVARQRGWNVYGTEYTEEAVGVCEAKGIKMHKGPLNPANYKGIEFDLVTSFEVIEHIYDPQAEIQKIKDILRLNGLLYITTPNFNSFSRYALGNKWTVIEYPEHLSYYTPKTLSVYLMKNGFEKVKIETTGIHVRRFKNSIGPAEGHNNSEEGLREKTETKIIYKYLKKIINGFLNVTQKGDNLKGTYIKKS